MGVAGERAQHPGGVSGIGGFLQDFAVDGHHGVGAQDDAAGFRLPGNVQSLVPGQAAGKVFRRLAGQAVFFDSAGPNVEIEARIAQQFAAAGRVGSQNQADHGPYYKRRLRKPTSCLT